MTKLCPRGKAAAKRKFKVYPSAYANAYASKICAGKAKDDRGVRRKDFKGPKPSGGGGTGAAARRIRKANKGLIMSNRLTKKPKGAVLGLLGTAAIMNMMKKQGKRAGRVQAEQGAMENQQKMNFGADQNNEAEGMRSGGFVSGSSIQGEYSETNPSTVDYYKGMGITD